MNGASFVTPFVILFCVQDGYKDFVENKLASCTIKNFGDGDNSSEISSVDLLRNENVEFTLNRSDVINSFYLSRNDNYSIHAYYLENNRVLKKISLGLSFNPIIVGGLQPSPK